MADKGRQVTDMGACLDLITKLERTPITKEVLESTRLGRYINNIRRKTSNQELYRRSKDLVRKWRKEVLADGVNGGSGAGPPGPGGTGSTGGTGGGGVTGVTAGVGNWHSLPPNSPSSLPSSGNTSPGPLSAPTTPSTLVQRTRIASPTLTTAHSARLKPMSPALLRGKVLSPGVPGGGCSPALSSASAITPPSASPAPPRSRPQSPAVNASLRQSQQSQAPRADASSYAPSTENVAKTNTANKRLRKDDDEVSSDLPVAKRPRNNITSCNGFDEDSRDSFSSVLSNDKGTSDSSSKRKMANLSRRHHKKNVPEKNKNISEASHSTITAADQLQQKISALPTSKAPKVKTTSQIVAELAERKGDSKLAERATKLEEQHVRELSSPAATLGMGRTADMALVNRNKMDHLQRFLSSQPSPASDDMSVGDDDDRGSVSTETEARESGSVPVSPTPPPGAPIPNPYPVTPSNLDLLGVLSSESAEEILSRLPPLDPSVIAEVKLWHEEHNEEQTEEQEYRSATGSDSEGNESEDETDRLVRKSNKVPTETVEVLHNSNLDCQNGNFDVDGKFREWHEVIVKKSYQDDPLVVLPYVITDF